MRAWTTLMLILISSATAPMPAEAHHSYPALFDVNKDVSVTGEVTRFEFRAPHAYIFLNVSAEDGSTTEWQLETTSPGQLIRKGVTPETLHPGDTVSAYGNPSRDGRNLMRLLKLKMANGEEKTLQ